MKESFTKPFKDKHGEEVEVDAGVAEIMEHLNDCSWLMTTSTCSGLKADHEIDDSETLSPSVCFMGKTFSEEGGAEDKSTLLPTRPTGDDIKLMNAIQEAGWHNNLHFYWMCANAYPQYIGHASSKNEDPTSNYKLILLGNLYGHLLNDISDAEKIEKWKDLVAVLSTQFCPSKNPYPDRQVPVTKPTQRRFEDAVTAPRGLPSHAAKGIFDTLLEYV